MQRACVVLAMLLAVALSRRALADDPKQAAVQAHLDVAYQAYKEGRWQDVLDAIDKAYAIDPQPEMDYSRGQVFQKLDRCKDVIAAYRKYLARRPRAANAGVAREAIASCKAKLKASRVKPETEPEPEPETQPKPEPETETEPKREPEPQKIEPPRSGISMLGIVLATGGGALVLSGGMFYVLARSDLGDAEGARTYAEQETLYDRAASKRLIAVGLAIGGVATATAGVIQIFRKRARDRARVGWIPSRDGGLVTWSGRF